MDIIVEYQQIFFLFCTIVLGYLAVKVFTFIKKPEEMIAEGRILQLDSIRFFLSASVMFSHSTLMYNYITDHNYKTNMFAFMAMYGVASFFAITGFIFWGFVRKNEDPDWLKIFFNRAFRIAPLVIVSTFLIIVTIYIYAVFSGVDPNPSMKAVYWFDFLNNNKPDFNGIKDAWVTTYGVHWTLVYEWGFYLSLPLLWMLGAGKRSTALILSLTFATIYILPIITKNNNLGFNSYSLLHFLMGMLACEFISPMKIKKQTADIILSVLVILIIFFLHKTGKLIYNTSSYMNAVVFLMIFLLYKGADLFGVLRNRCFVILGEASYSIYITHALVMFVVFKLASHLNMLTSHTVLVFMLAYFLVYVVSLISYTFIERPMISLGKLIYKRIS